MQAMASSSEHLINSDPPPARGVAGGRCDLGPARDCQLAPATPVLDALHGAVLPCQMVEALAGDCRSSLGERLQRIDRECGFGQSCLNGCQRHHPAEGGFVGNASVRLACVGPATPPGMAGNDDGF